jgi:hypothetical protein
MKVLKFGLNFSLKRDTEFHPNVINVQAPPEEHWDVKYNAVAKVLKPYLYE